MADGTFAPDESVTREQAADILYRTAEFLENKTIPDAAKMSYADESEISDWAKSAVACMNVMGICGGKIPFGYSYDKNLGIIVPNEDAAKV